MPAPLRGRLISSSFAADLFPSLPIRRAVPARVAADMEHCAERLDSLGPASSVRAIADVVVAALLTALQWTPVGREDTPSLVRVHTTGAGHPGPILLVTAWGDSLDRAWRAAVRDAIAGDARWCLTCNGTALRVIDARRTWSRDYVEFDLASGLRQPEAQALLWSLLCADAFGGPSPALDQAIGHSARHGADVCRALGRGVLHALALMVTSLRRPTRGTPAVLFEHSLTVLYRVLFLLFAEARGLVPLWHPVYRSRYSLDQIVSQLLAGRPYRGLWHAVQAISRLAHAGCSVGELKVTAFNGRLFAPSQAASFDRVPVPDDVMREAVIALGSLPGTPGQARTRIAYRDLDVEQLGAVYEQVLDYEPAGEGKAPLVRTRDVRKSSGAFYTPRSLTGFLVSQTLEPLVRGRSHDELLALRVLDPAMGSGAFLVAACRYLARAAENALVAEGRWHAGDVTASDRALLRRDIASRCLYGVDVNPMAVQLARLSLWLATLAADKPLSFLDHHLVAGDSLLGASPADVQRRPTRDARRPRRSGPLPLFEDDALAGSLADVARTRLALALEADDSAAVVRRKERTLASLAAGTTPVNRWGRVLDLWCAGWFWGDGRAPDRGVFGELVQRLLSGRSALPDSRSGPLLAHAADVATRLRFLHWPLTFPEVFEGGGFDAVIGNPPWDMVRGDSGAGSTRGSRQRLASDSNAFFRESGVYMVDTRAHANRYQLFTERALQLLRRGGRVGLILPSGLVTDTGSAPLRRHLFDRADLDSVTGLDNRNGIFPIHRSVRFALVTGTAGSRTDRIDCRFGLEHVEEVESGGRAPLSISRSLLERVSGSDDLGIPELVSARDLQIVEHISAYVPWMGASAGWNVRFGRELNATDDRAAFTAFTDEGEGRPVIEGKQLGPFHVNVASSHLRLRPDAAAGHRVPRRSRLAYRDIASATNRLTLIAAIVPSHVVTTHTLFCLKTMLPLSQQQVLCALLNSFVANYLIRMRVTTHVTATLMSRLPVPVVPPGHRAFLRLQQLHAALARSAVVESAAEYVELQALAAHLYGLSAADFEHVLATFPLIPEAIRRASLERFTRESCRHPEP